MNTILVKADSLLHKANTVIREENDGTQDHRKETTEILKSLGLQLNMDFSYRTPDGSGDIKNNFAIWRSFMNKCSEAKFLMMCKDAGLVAKHYPSNLKDHSCEGYIIYPKYKSI